MAQTLDKIVAIGGETSAKGVVDILQKESQLLAVIPFVPTEGTYTYKVQTKRGGAGFRSYNGDYSSKLSEYEKKYAEVKFIGNDIKIDMADVLQYSKDEDWFAKHIDNSVVETKYTFQHAFLKGDTDTNPAEFDGVLKLVDSSQVLVATEDIVADLDDITSRVKGRGPDYLVMNKATRNKVTAAARLQQVTETKNNFGAVMTAYNHVPIVALDNDEIEDDYVVAVQFGEKAVHGIVNPKGIRAVDLGESQEHSTYNGRVDFYAGLVVADPRTLAVRKPVTIEEG